MKILRSKYILKKIFGKKYKIIKSYFYNIFRPFIFKFDKKIDQQSLVKKEKGFIINGTVNNFFTYHLRPKKSDNFHLFSSSNVNEKVGIIIQGNIGNNYSFLKETLKIYEKIFPNIQIILSTWKSESQIDILKLESKNVKILFNEEPNEKSPGNTNYQIMSTYAGLKYAQEIGLEYCLKQRTDIRIYKNDAIAYLLSLLKIFPLKQKNKFKNRIISTSLTTLKYRLFSISDYVLFGNTKDLLLYFDNLDYSKSLIKHNFGHEPCFIQDTPVEAEIFLCARYLKQNNENLDWNLDFWWKSVKEYFCIIDSISLDLIWAKYDYDIEHRFYKSYSNKFSRCIEFSDWLLLYNEEVENNWKKFFNDHERYNKDYSLINYKY